MQDNEKTETEHGQFPVLMTVAICWAVLGLVLWLFGFLTISVAWIVGPTLYMAHMNLQYGLVKKAVKEEMEKALDTMDVNVNDLAVVTFEDATHLEGKLN